MFLFYRDVLGLEAGWGDEKGQYAEFNTGSTKISLFSKAAMAEVAGTSSQPLHSPQQDPVALVLATPNVEKACEELERKGVEFLTEPTDRPGWGVRTAHFRDPEGNLLEINTLLPS